MTTTTLHRDSYWQIAAPVLFVMLWSTGFIGAKLGLPFAEPFTFLLWRYGTVTLLLLTLTLVMRAPWPATPVQAAHIAVSGVMVNAVYIGGVFFAINQGVPSGIVSLIVGLQPLFTAVVAGRLLGEKVSGRQWVGFALGLVYMRYCEAQDQVLFCRSNRRTKSEAAIASRLFVFWGPG